jgi:formiminotetrahydrofolate cyclodeaminase
MLDSFIDALARPMPVPGGGAAAAHGACVGLALLEKIVQVEIQRSRDYSGPEWKNLLQEVKKSSTALLQLRDEDGKTYLRFAQAKTFGKGETEVLKALVQAIECPIKIMEEANEAINYVARAGMHCKDHLVSDLLVVCELLRATINGAHRIAQANLNLMQSHLARSDYQNKLEQLLIGSRELYESVVSKLVERAGFGRAISACKC